MIKNQTGYATMAVFGITLIVSAILLAYGIWVRWEAQTTKSFLEREIERQKLNDGIGQAIELLLVDDEMEVDWLGEAWAKHLETEDFAVQIIDEGSKLGINWIDERLWKNLLPTNHEKLESLFSELREEKRLISSIEEVNSRLDVDLNGNIFTVYSMFNVNIMGEFELESLWRSMGMDQLRARSAAAEIARKRNEQRLNEIGELEKVNLLPRSIVERLEPWLVFTGPININTAPSEVLAAVLKHYDLDEKVGNLVRVRATRPIHNHSELAELLDSELVDDQGNLNELGRWFCFQSQIFRISGETSSRRIETIVKRTRDEARGIWEITVLSWIER